MYAYTKAFIKSFMPNTINPRSGSLPHLKCQLQLFSQLLRYHDIELYEHLAKYEIDPECYATGWVLTNLSRVISFSLSFELIDIIIHEKDQLLILFMCVALMKLFRQEVLATSCMEDCLSVMKRKLKVKTIKKLSQIYYEAVGL